MTSQSIMAVWEHDVASESTMHILPDGCVDLILVRPRLGAPFVMVSHLSHTITPPAIRSPAHLTGIRLRPATHISIDAVKRSFCARTDDPDAFAAAVEENLSPNTEAAEIVAALADQGAGRISNTARRLGISPRRMQRTLQSAGQPPPRFWRQLARARRAGRALLTKTPLADIAADAGYADQAQFTRDMRRWFGATPMSLANDPAFAAQITAHGLGDQIL